MKTYGLLSLMESLRPLSSFTSGLINASVRTPEQTTKEYIQNRFFNFWLVHDGNRFGLAVHWVRKQHKEKLEETYGRSLA